MNYKKILFVSVCSVGLFLGNVNAQDIHFSQFYMDPLQQNPALAGADHDLEAVLNYKNQWSSVATPYKTIAFSYDMRLTRPNGKRKGFWAAGINFYSDNSGAAQVGTTQANLTVAYHVLTGQKSHLGAGIMAGYAQRSINYSQLQWGNQYDGMSYNASLPTGEPAGANNSISYLDGAAGLDWTYDNTSGIDVTDNHEQRLDVGFSVFHFNQPNYSFYGDGEKLLMRFTFHANGVFSLGSSNLALAPGILYYKQGSANEEYVGTLVRFMLQQNSKYTGAAKSAALSVGGYYRNQDAFVAAMLLEYANYTMGVSYDINTSNLTSASKGMGGLELSLRFVMPNPYFQGGGKGGNKAMF